MKFLRANIRSIAAFSLYLTITLEFAFLSDYVVSDLLSRLALQLVLSIPSMALMAMAMEDK